MKKVFFTLLVSLLATVSISAQSRVEERSMKSEILGVEKTFSVYLPDGYDDDNSTRYPVLYLLHGAFGQNTDWHTHADLQLIADRMIAADSVRPMIVVMPDARGVAKNLAGENMGYFNVEGWPYEDYFFEEFIPYIERTFRVDTARESRAVFEKNSSSPSYAERYSGRERSRKRESSGQKWVNPLPPSAYSRAMQEPVSCRAEYFLRIRCFSVPSSGLSSSARRSRDSEEE